MSNNKQSSVVWLKSTVKAMIANCGDSDLHAVLWHIEQAKAMHKKETIDFALHCMMPKLNPDKATIATISDIYDEVFKQ